MNSTETVSYTHLDVYKRQTYDTMPEDTAPAAIEKDLIYLGLSGMIDPIRPEVKAAIAECRSAGIRPIMITGDHRDTAVAIAKQLGILDEGQKLSLIHI